MFVFTVYDLLANHLPHRADHPALVSGETEVTYGQLARRCETLAAWLHDNGVRRGDRVGVHLRKSVDEVVTTLAIARIGAVFVNVNYQWTLRQLRYVVEDCGIRVLFTDGRRAEAIARSGLAESLERVVVADTAPDRPGMVSWASLPTNRSAPDIRPIDMDLAALVYTSGSTGQPKGVMLSHLNLLQMTRSSVSYLHNCREDRALGLLPMSYVYGLSQVTTMLLVGGTVVLQPVMMPAEIVKTVASKQVTGIAAVPPAWIQVVAYLQESGTGLPSLRYVTNSGGKIPKPTLDAMPRVLPGVEIYLNYGMTEVPRSIYLPSELFDRKKGAIGRAGPNLEVYVVDPQKGICGPGEQGELIHRGSSVMQGYWNKPQATARALKVCEHLRPLLGEEKVLHSGDIVRLDEDGYLWFVGRADTMIKCSGHRISPTEVEEIIYESSLADEVVAFGMDDDALGQVVHVAVAPPEGRPLNSEALQQFCRKHMPNYMVPRRVHTWDGEMPRTSSGKVDRRAVIKASAEVEGA